MPVTCEKVVPARVTSCPVAATATNVDAVKEQLVMLSDDRQLENTPIPVGCTE